MPQHDAGAMKVNYALQYLALDVATLATTLGDETQPSAYSADEAIDVAYEDNADPVTATLLAISIIRQRVVNMNAHASKE
jgi:hypothetical protein